jgi:hypothetical protein
MLLFLTTIHGAPSRYGTPLIYTFYEICAMNTKKYNRGILI